MQKNNLPAPLRITQAVAKEFPGCWDDMDIFINDRGKPDFTDWHEMCYLPIAAGYAVVVKKMKDVVKSAKYAAIVTAAAIWRKFKEIYSFDEDLKNLLYEQSDDELVIPSVALKNLPFPCIYITLDEEICGIHWDGFFTWIEWDIPHSELELRFSFIPTESDAADPLFSGGFSLHLAEGDTLADGIAAFVARSKTGAQQVIDSSPDWEYAYGSAAAEHIHRALMLVLYLCAENAQREENPDQKNITRRGATIKDAYREIRKWDVGYRIGNAIRAEADNPSKAEPAQRQSGSERAPYRPHVRKGHYHHYWIGSDKTNSRRLILKWVAPMFINFNENDDTDFPATVHPVK